MKLKSIKPKSMTPLFDAFLSKLTDVLSMKPHFYILKEFVLFGWNAIGNRVWLVKILAEQKSW